MNNKEIPILRWESLQLVCWKSPTRDRVLASRSQARLSRLSALQNDPAEFTANATSEPDDSRPT